MYIYVYLLIKTLKQNKNLKFKIHNSLFCQKQLNSFYLNSNRFYLRLLIIFKTTAQIFECAAASLYQPPLKESSALYWIFEKAIPPPIN